MVTELILENFTVFENLKMDFSPGINVIIGKNATGKTHTLRIIYSILLADKKTSPLWKHADYLNKIYGNFLPNDEELKDLIRFSKGKTLPQANITIYHSNSKGKPIIVPIGKLAPGGILIEHERYSNEIVYIPPKEMLANAPGFGALYRKYKMSFEEVYQDIIDNAYLSELRKLPSPFNEIVKTLENEISGKVILEGETFFLKTFDQNKIVFTLVAEGWRKLALLLLLIKNGSISKGSLLLWDEPEANMNPVLIRLIVKILLQLEREGVQVILATHSYVLLKEFDLQRKKEHKLMFHALYKEKEDGPAKCESAEQYLDINNNAIHEEFDSLYDRQLDVVYSS